MSTIKQFNSEEEISRQKSEELLKVISINVFSDYELSTYKDKYFKIEKNRFLPHELITVSPTPFIVVGEAPKGLIRSELPADAMLRFWNNRICPMYTLTLWWSSQRRPKPVSMRCYVPVHSKECTSLRTDGIGILLIRNKMYLTSYTLDSKKLDPEFWNYLEKENPKENIGEVNAAKIYINSYIEKPKSPIQRLQAGWSKRLEQEISKVFQSYKDPSKAKKIEMELPVIQSSPFNNFFRKNDILLSELYKFLYKMFEDPELDSLRVISTIEGMLKDAPIHNFFIHDIMKCAWFAPSLTKLGLSFLSIQPDGKLEEINIDIKALGKNVENFWYRLPFTFLLFNYQLIGNGACPIEPEHFYKSFPLYQGEITEGWNFVHDLLAEATSLKQWTIPSGAYVQLDIGEIKAVKLFECGHIVTCLLLNSSSEYYLLWINPYNENFNFTHTVKLGSVAGRIAAKMEMENDQISKDKLEILSENTDDPPIMEKLKLAIAIPISAIIRDFWVVEERDKVFGAARTKRKAPILPTDQRQEPIVYLPRIRYVSNIKRLAEPLHLENRRPHFVTGHLRRAAEASEKQIFLAKRYSIMVPEGFTFVRPHRRGEKAQETIYRSRSALQCIRALRPLDATDQRDSWFNFELNVKNWLQKNGFEVEHLAANKNGDGGVDLQAHKGDDVLLIQCKYWHTKRIGPAVIRELIGTLQTFPKGTKAVLITSTELTVGAQKLAKNNGIEFLQNVNFSKEINFKLI